MKPAAARAATRRGSSITILLPGQPRRVQQRQRHLGGLARAGRRFQHQPRLCGQRSADVGQQRGDGELHVRIVGATPITESPLPSGRGGFGRAMGDAGCLHGTAARSERTPGVARRVGRAAKPRAAANRSRMRSLSGEACRGPRARARGAGGYNSGMQLIDIGANLTHDSFDHDRDAVLAARTRCRRARSWSSPAPAREHSPKALELARSRIPANWFATAGVHPHHATEYTAECDAEMRALHAHPEVVAVGECGLDYFRDFSPRPAQRSAFEKQLQIAVDLAVDGIGKPLFLHQRDAHADFMAMMKQLRRPDRAGGGALLHRHPRGTVRLPRPATGTSASPAGSATNAAARTCASWCKQHPRPPADDRNRRALPAAAHAQAACRSTGATSRCSCRTSSRNWRATAARMSPPPRPTPRPPARAFFRLPAA